MEMEQPPEPNPHHVSPKHIAYIIVVVAIGLLIGFELIAWTEKRQARKRGGSGGIGHAVPQTFLVRDTNGMVWIPSSGFYMGNTKGPIDQQPEHLVTLNGFWMDKNEVTIEQFSKFIQATGYKTTRELQTNALTPLASWRMPLGSGRTNINLKWPVTWVSWVDATAYAQWAKKRLPTEAEWEYAARGSLDRQAWPWGQHFGNQTNNMENLKGTTEPEIKPVRSFSANAYGLLDMAGNVSEWCADWYGKDYYQQADKVNPRGSVTGHERVVRGASFLIPPSDLPLGVNAWRRSTPPQTSAGDIGFRCVQGM